mgnify:CR=1 FL=1
MLSFLSCKLNVKGYLRMNIHCPLYKRIFEPKLSSGACFSKVPKLLGLISGDIIPFVSAQRRRFEARNFAVFIFIPFTTYEKDQLYRISRLEFYEWLFGPEKLSGLSSNGPLSRVNYIHNEIHEPCLGTLMEVGRPHYCNKPAPMSKQTCEEKQ